MLNTLL